MKIRRPVADKYPISSPYGPRIDPITKKETEFHRGIDFACPVGTEVRAVVDGTIERVGYESENNHAQGFGLRVWQTFKDERGVKFGFVYGHLSDLDVKEHMDIKEGEIIGLSGNSGKSTGPHLHVGCRAWDTNQWEEISCD